MAEQTTLDFGHNPDYQRAENTSATRLDAERTELLGELLVEVMNASDDCLLIAEKLFTANRERSINLGEAKQRLETAANNLAMVKTYFDARLSGLTSQQSSDLADEIQNE